MGITKKDVIEVAELARLDFEADEVDEFASQFENIMKFISKLDELDTDGIEPTSHVLDMTTPLREDSVDVCLSQEESLYNAPDKNNGFFAVPKIIED